MLLPDNIHPEDTIYFNASIVIKELLKKDSQEMIDLYQKVKENKEMSFSIFVLCLDWLYLLNALKLSKTGIVELCI